MQIDRIDGQDRDIGLARHWLDPTIPFAVACLLKHMALLLLVHCKTTNPKNTLERRETVINL